MKPAPFDYVATESLDEALRALAEAGDEAKLIAGGQSLVPLMALRLAQPAVLVDINGATGFPGIERTDNRLTVGALVRHATLERSADIRAAVPLLADAVPLIGHPAIRTRGTLGGSLAHADPAAELPAVALALDASFTARSASRGERTIAAADFFEGYFTTALADDEILCSVSFPVAGPATGHALEEVARRHGDFAMVGAVAAVTVDGGAVSDARLAFINVAERPVRAHDAERALVGSAPTSDVLAEAAQSAAASLDPPGDLHASPAYRRRVAAVCARRALATAARRAQEGS